jgi:general nucleoside transport system permease protein
VSTPPAEQPSKSWVEATGDWFASKIGGLLVPVAAAVLAFLVGGLVVVATGNDPFSAYRAIFNGTGLNWFFPWVWGDERFSASLDLQQTLLLTAPLMLTACAVAFAFRCGMFNIGGQGQYFVGLMTAVWIGHAFSGMPRPLHVLLASVGAILAGAIWAAIAGFLKASVGAHEVISTIMLNWIALWVGKWLVELGGPMQGSDPDVPRSYDIADSAKLWPIWGALQPLHAGIFIALFGLLVYHVVLNRTTVGYEVRAVGFNPDAARYGGISVSRNYILAMGISGAFAGMAGAVDMLGWKFHQASNDFDVSTSVGFIGIAVALLGRNKAVGMLFAALLFGALQVGTSPRQLTGTDFPPELATNLSTMIQALIILFVGAELLIVSAWNLRKRVGFGDKPPRVKAQEV